MSVDLGPESDLAGDIDPRFNREPDAGQDDHDEVALDRFAARKPYRSDAILSLERLDLGQK